MITVKDVSKFDYMRNRPFLLITRSAVPARTGRNGTKTERKGWSSDQDNVRIEETPLLTNRVSDRQLRAATVVIDIQNDRILKNNVDSIESIKAQAEIDRQQDRIAELRYFLKTGTGTLSPDEIKQAIQSIKKTIDTVRQDRCSNRFWPESELMVHYKKKYSDAFQQGIAA